MREERAKSGRVMYYVSRHELENLPGYRGNDRKGRACCPIHAGTNPTALAINWETGWASCWSCGDAWLMRVEDHFDSHGLRERIPGVIAPKRPAESSSDPINVPAELAHALATAAVRFPDSPGATYLAGRAIPLEVARRLGIGWSSTGQLAGRVVFPLTNPEGVATSAIGRAIDDRTRPKYKALALTNGYAKTLFNGGAIAYARQSGHPLVVAEGPLDAAACMAAGLPLTVAICGKTYAHPEHFAGLRTVILALDADEAGQAGRRRLWLDLMARGINVLVLPGQALEGTKDLAEYWQRHRMLPGQLMVAVVGPHIATAGSNGTHLPVRGTMTADDLCSPALRAEAEALAMELMRNPEEATQFLVELEQGEALMTAEDRWAAHYVAQLIRAHDWSSMP